MRWSELNHKGFPLSYSDCPVLIDVHRVELLPGGGRELGLRQYRLVLLHAALDFLPADAGLAVRVADLHHGVLYQEEVFPLQGTRSGGGQQAGDTQEEEEELEHDDLTEAVRGTLSVSVRPEAFIVRENRSDHAVTNHGVSQCDIAIAWICIG